jgi:hypothetical protein
MRGRFRNLFPKVRSALWINKDFRMRVHLNTLQNESSENYQESRRWLLQVARCDKCAYARVTNKKKRKTQHETKTQQKNKKDSKKSIPQSQASHRTSYFLEFRTQRRNGKTQKNTPETLRRVVRHVLYGQSVFKNPITAAKKV